MATAMEERQIGPAWPRALPAHRRLFPVIDEAAATTSAEQHDHREGLQDAVRQAVADHPSARWSLSGRRDLIAAVARHLAGAAGPARMTTRTPSGQARPHRRSVLVNV